MYKSYVLLNKLIMKYILGWAKVWNIFFYSKTFENNVTKQFVQYVIMLIQYVCVYVWFG